MHFKSLQNFYDLPNDFINPSYFLGLIKKNHTASPMNRRKFLATSSCTLALSQVLSAKSYSLKGRIKKAVKFGTEPNEKQMMKLKDLGFDGIEGNGPGLQVGAMRNACAKFNLPMHGLVYSKHWHTRLSDPSPEVREQSRVGLAQSMREAQAVGGTSVLLVPGKVGGANETHQHVWDRSIEQIKKLLPLADELKIHILIETVWNGFCYKPEQFRDYIDAIDSQWVKAYYDIGNMQKYGPSHKWIKILGERTRKLDVKDWGSKNGFCPLGQGDVEWKKVRHELEKIDFNGWATREGSDGGVENTARLMNELLDL